MIDDNITKDNNKTEDLQLEESTVNDVVTETAEKVKHKKSIKEVFKGLLTGFVEIFKDYPVALASVIILAFLGALLVDHDIEYPDWVIYIAHFFAVFSAGALFSEQLFKKKLSIGFITSIVLNVLFSIFYTYQFNAKKPWFFGMGEDAADHYLMYILIFVITAEAMITLYSMYKCSGTNFENYCISAFTELFKTTLIYTVFAIGILIILLIFEALIADTDDFIEQIEIFLLGGVLAPLAIKALSKTITEATKFAKIMILYVLMPLLILAYGVIYIYIFKIIFTFELPNNEVFRILAFLFSIGMPIWTMAQSFENAFIGKVARFMPFAFVPFVILHIVCIGLRISQYGYTFERYWGVILVIFEIIYLVLYTVKFILKNEAVSLAFLIVPVIVFCGTLMPVVNCDAIVIASQSAILNSVYDKNKTLSDRDKETVQSAFREIRWAGYLGEKYIDDHFSKAEIEEIDEWSSSYLSYTDYYYFNNYMSDYDISEYSHFYDGFYADASGKDLDMSEVVLSRSNSDVTFIIDFSDYVEDAMDYYDSVRDGSDYVKNHPYVVDENCKCYINYLRIESVEGDGIVNYRIDCVVLEK